MRNSHKWFIIIAFTALCLISFTACNMDSSSNDPGSSKENAISLYKEDTWRNGELTASRTEQWFRFTATAYTQYIHVFFGTLTDLTIQLYGNNNNPIGNPNELCDSMGKTAYTTYPVTRSKTYYIKVTGNGNSDIGTYRIGFNTMQLEPGKSSGATELFEDIWTNGEILPSTGEQWFRFTATASKHYLHVFSSPFNLNLQLFDSSGKVYGNKKTLPDNGTEYWPLNLETYHVYYVNVTGTSNSKIPYRITFNNSTTPPN